MPLSYNCMPVWLLCLIKHYSYRQNGSLTEELVNRLKYYLRRTTKIKAVMRSLYGVCSISINACRRQYRNFIAVNSVPQALLHYTVRYLNSCVCAVRLGPYH
jgi:hypothetical protein